MELENLLNRWEKKLSSKLSHHGEECCSLARSWFLALDRSLRPGDEAMPVWIRQRYEWGPSPWPLFWCEAVRADRLDCGALAALAREALASRRALVFPRQLVQRFDRGAIAQWKEVWRKAGCPIDWIAEEYVYHEACAVLQGGDLKIFDPTDNVIISPERDGYGGLVAIRLEGVGALNGWVPAKVGLLDAWNHSRGLHHLSYQSGT